MSWIVFLLSCFVRMLAFPLQRVGCLLDSLVGRIDAKLGKFILPELCNRIDDSPEGRIARWIRRDTASNGYVYLQSLLDRFTGQTVQKMIPAYIPDDNGKHFRAAERTPDI